MGITLLLIDRPGERLEEHNIVRHLLGYSSLGKLKLRETARYVAEFNPAARVSIQPLDVVDKTERFAELMREWGPDVIAVCTDNEQSKHAINQVAVPLGIPQIGAGVYDGGIGGEIYKVMAGEACYGCIADYLQLRRFSPPRKPHSEYNGAEAEELPSVSALNLDIEQIALLQCRMLLEVLLKETAGFIGLRPKINLCVFANRIVPGTFSRPWHGEFFEVPRHEDCLDCGTTPPDVEEDAERILTELGQRERKFSGSAIE
jgi:molybdopterin/thiamine biosynthesis adenylyltransferase